jgi:hypothetical protein
MKRNIAMMLMVLFLATLPLSVAAAAPAGKGKPAAARAEHPRVVRAIHAIEGAIDELQKAPDDFGGHKDEAIEACRNAIAQLKKGLQYQDRHEKTGP